MERISWSLGDFSLCGNTVSFDASMTMGRPFTVAVTVAMTVTMATVTTPGVS